MNFVTNVQQKSYLTSTIKHPNISILQQTSKGQRQRNSTRKKIKTNMLSIQDAVKPLLLSLGKTFIILPDLNSRQ